VFEEDESSPMWQRLETILTAWIEMTERRKVAVVHKDLGNGPDPASGVYLDTQTPWGWAPWTKANLEDALDAWNDLLSAINDRFPEPHAEPLSGPCIFDVEDLRAVNIGDGSFVGEFYKKACRPFFQFLAPGLELASSEQLFDDVSDGLGKPRTHMEVDGEARTSSHYQSCSVRSLQSPGSMYISTRSDPLLGVSTWISYTHVHKRARMRMQHDWCCLTRSTKPRSLVQ
jgi:hypothetical protein